MSFVAQTRLGLAALGGRGGKRRPQYSGATPTESDGNDSFGPTTVIVLGDAASLTKGGQGNSIEDKRYQYG